MWFWKKAGIAVAEAPHEERRTSLRYEGHESPVQVGWIEKGELRLIPAHLLDFSSGGAKIEVETAPTTDSVVLFRLTNTDCPDTLEARLVAVDPPGPACKHCRPLNGYVLHLAFAEPCSYEFFKAALDWLVTTKPQTPCVCAEFDGRSWR